MWSLLEIWDLRRLSQKLSRLKNQSIKTKRKTTKPSKLNSGEDMLSATKKDLPKLMMMITLGKAHSIIQTGMNGEKGTWKSLRIRRTRLQWLQRHLR
jgi:hypothetical protein